MSSFDIPRLAILLALVAASFGIDRRAGASVAVLANRTAQAITVSTFTGKSAPRPLTIPAGGSRPIISDDPVRVRIGAISGREYPIEADTAYEIKRAATGAITLTPLHLGDAGRHAWKPLSPSALPLMNAGVIKVKVVVDDDEVRSRQSWEPTIRKRLDAASAVFQAHAGVQLKIVAIDAWDSDDAQFDFSQTLRELEREVNPAPADVVIGFSSQYLIQRGRFHMGGTRGALHSHIILKERAPNVLETERLELLVHELGHYFGATHSKDRASVMRPTLGEGLQRRAGAQIHFDPANTMLMALLGQELRLRRVRSLDEVLPETRQQMQQLYATLQQELSDDNSAGNYLKRLAGAGIRPLVEDARTVLLTTAREVKRQKQMRGSTIDAARVAADPLEAALRHEGDQLLEMYVREAAVAAKAVRPENGPRALLLALGVAMDDAGVLKKLPFAAQVAAHLEGEDERQARVAAVGEPSMRGRPDLAKHFFISAYLTALGGRDAALGAGAVKELFDANGGSGFSFADVAADRAGVMFAGAVLSGRLTLDDVAQRFTVADFMPAIDGLDEKLTGPQLAEKYGALNDRRMTAELQRIDALIMALPAYQPLRPPVR